MTFTPFSKCVLLAHAVSGYISNIVKNPEVKSMAMIFDGMQNH